MYNVSEKEKTKNKKYSKIIAHDSSKVNLVFVPCNSAPPLWRAINLLNRKTTNNLRLTPFLNFSFRSS